MALQESLCQVVTVQYAPSGDKCEDACSFSFEREALHYAGVFDGCGGLGGRRYERLCNKTGAFIASQTCAEVFHDETEKQESSIDDAFVSRLKSAFLSALREREKHYGQKSEIFGSMVCTLPCTGSMFAVTQEQEYPGSLRLDIVHAGDSRVYIMRPTQGLQQVTRDELIGAPDALKNLYVSAPLSNVINMDKDFSLKRISFQMETPFAVLCASDGMFGYVKTPMHFEKLILDSLEDADSFAEFEKTLFNGIAGITGDDSTAVMPFYGWTSFAQLKEAFAKRHRFVSGLCQSVEGNISDEIVDLAWNQYKSGYYWQDTDR